MKFSRYSVLTLLLFSCQLVFSQLNTLEETYLNDQPQLMIQQQWSSNDSIWESVQQFEFGYGGNSRSYDYLFASDIYSNGNIAPNYRKTYFYDPDGQLRSILEERYQAGSWGNFVLEKYEFDSQRNKISYAWLEWTNSQWDTVLATRDLIAYNSSNLPDSTIQQIWVASASTFANKDLLRYHYSAAMEIDTIHTFRISSGISNPIPLKKETIFAWHNFPQREKDSSYTYSWNSSFGNYEISTKNYDIFDSTALRKSESIYFNNNAPINNSIRIFDGLGYILVDSAANWNGNAWQTTNSKNYAPSFDSQGRVSVVEVSEWTAGGIYVPWRKFIFNNFTTSELEAATETAQIEIGPNPANTFLNIRSNFNPNGPVSFQLFDLKGRLIVEIVDPNSTGETRLSLPEFLPSGSYILVVQNRKARGTAKVQILR